MPLSQRSPSDAPSRTQSSNPGSEMSQITTAAGLREVGGYLSADATRPNHDQNEELLFFFFWMMICQVKYAARVTPRYLPLSNASAAGIRVGDSTRQHTDLRPTKI